MEKTEIFVMLPMDIVTVGELSEGTERGFLWHSSTRFALADCSVGRVLLWGTKLFSHSFLPQLHSSLSRGIRGRLCQW